MLLGELAHQRVKRMFPVVQKSTFALGIAKYEQQQRILNKMHDHAPKSSKPQKCKLGKSGKPPEVPWIQFEDHCLAHFLNEDHDGDVLQYTPTQR
ncbi:hypothetical protein C0992_007060 [Termitomyces sp. T32_za158]|nr:hypothetical protein C0992_007060 [Termitomyces sp. T32_za158]